MNSQLVSVEKTDYEEYFEDIESDSIFLLNKASSLSTWKNAIGMGASYFSLSIEHWIIKSKAVELGKWQTAYNDDKPFKVSKLLKKKLRWGLDEDVWYFISKNVVFQTKWSYFLLHWDDFLAVDDDCPIIMCESRIGEEALVFKPMGGLSFIKRRT